MSSEVLLSNLLAQSFGVGIAAICPGFGYSLAADLIKGARPLERQK
jgi:hypothetical protein